MFDFDAFIVSIDAFFSHIPSIDPLAGLILLCIGPLVFWLLCLWVYRRLYYPGLTWRLCAAKLVVTRAGTILAFNFVVISLLVLNQVSCFCKLNDIGVDIMYYTKVDLPEYDALDAYQTAGSESSLNSVLSHYNPKKQHPIHLDKYGRMTSLSSSSSSSSSLASSLNSFWESADQSHRRLYSTTTISLVYHTSSWENLITNDYQLLKDVCMTERNIRMNLYCFDQNIFVSVIDKLFYPYTCIMVGDPYTVIQSLTPEEISSYFEDGFNQANPSSSIIISTTITGSCKSQYTADELSSALNDNDVGEVKVTFAQTKFLQEEFTDSVINAAELSAAGLALAFAFFIIWIRGLISGLMTFICLLFCLAGAGGTLSTWNYGSFSAFNVMSIFILVGVGANAILIFDTQWRRVVKPGHAITAIELLIVYSHLGEPTLFTIIAACLSLFSKLASPVIVISQLGAYMGTAVVILYALFHYIIIPVWIITNRFRLPMAWHRFVDGIRVYLANLCKPYIGLFAMCRGVSTPVGSASNSSGKPDRGTIQYQRLETSALDDHKNKQIEDQHPSFSAGAARVYDSSSASREPDSVSLISGVRSVRTGDVLSDTWSQADTAAEITPAIAEVSHSVMIPSPLQEGEEISETSGIWSCCKKSFDDFFTSYYFLLVCRLVVLLACLAGLVAIVFLVQMHYVIDFGIPQLFSPSTNLGQCFIVVRFYKSSILDYSISVLPPISPRPTNQPTPTFAPSRGTPQPTFIPTKAPTFSPFDRRPTFTPTKSPIAPPPTVDTNPVYTITGCYGISFDKQFKDTEVNPTWNGEVFSSYAFSDGFLEDQFDLCQYVEDNRYDLNVDPNWVMERDCLYYQLLEAASRADRIFGETNVTKSVATAPQAKGIDISKESSRGNLGAVTNLQLLTWGVSSVVAGSLLGIEVDESGNNRGGGSTADSGMSLELLSDMKARRGRYFDVDLSGSDDAYSFVTPVWICNNFSVLSPVSSLVTNTDVARSLMSSWTSVFKDHGSSQASKSGVAVQISSDAFTLPLLASEVLRSIELAGIISLAGFVVLLFCYTLDVGLMLAGTIVMTLILATTFCLHLYFTTNIIDLLDIVVLIAIIGMIVDFPVHMLSYFLKQREALLVLRLHHKRLMDEIIANDHEIGIAPDQLLLGRGASIPPIAVIDPEPLKNIMQAGRTQSVERTREALDLLKNEQPHVLNSFEEDRLSHGGLAPQMDRELMNDADQAVLSLGAFFSSEEMYHSGMSRSQLQQLSRQLSEESVAPDGSVVVRDNHESAHSMAYGLFAPMVTSVLVAVPLLYATLELLKKTGEYIIIMAVVSYVVTCFVCPWLLALTCRTDYMSKTAEYIRERWYKTNVTVAVNDTLRRLSGSGAQESESEAEAARRAEMLAPLVGNSDQPLNTATEPPALMGEMMHGEGAATGAWVESNDRASLPSAPLFTPDVVQDFVPPAE